MGEPASYEERFGPFRRRFERLRRAVRWRMKGMLGRSRTWLVEIKWRLGDEIMAISTYHAIKKEYPSTVLHVLCNYPELLSGNSAVDRINSEIVAPDRYTLLRGAPRDVPRWQDYAAKAGVAPASENPVVPAPEKSPFAWIGEPGGRIVFAPGASWPVKRWAADRWRVLAETIREDTSEIIVLGNEGEGIGVERDLTGHTSVSDCVALLQRADVCVCSDSGLMHLALAAGCRTVGLFGATAPEYYVPDPSQLTVIGNERECSVCWNRTMEMQEPGVCPRGIPDCMATIEPERVAAAVREARAASRSRAAH